MKEEQKQTVKYWRVDRTRPCTWTCVQVSGSSVNRHHPPTSTHPAGRTGRDRPTYTWWTGSTVFPPWAPEIDPRRYISHTSSSYRRTKHARLGWLSREGRTLSFTLLLWGFWGGVSMTWLQTNYTCWGFFFLRRGSWICESLIRLNKRKTTIQSQEEYEL